MRMRQISIEFDRFAPLFDCKCKKKNELIAIKILSDYDLCVFMPLNKHKHYDVMFFVRWMYW